MKWLIVIVLAVTAWTSSTFAQGTPFFSAGATIAEPQIAVASTGSELPVQHAVVSADRKYVTLDLSPANYTLAGFHTFTFQTGAGGFVGGTAAQNSTDGIAQNNSSPFANSHSLTPSIASTPSQVAPTPSPLEKTGMTFIAPLRPTH